MLERTSLLKIAMAAVFAASLAALPLTLSAQETTEPATKSDPASKAKKKATTRATAKSKATETPAAEPKSTQSEPATTDSKGRPLSAGRIAATERQKKCGAEWRGLSKDEQTKQGPTWPKYWSACNTRLKAEAQPAQPAQPKGKKS